MIYIFDNGEEWEDREVWFVEATVDFCDWWSDVYLPWQASLGGPSYCGPNWSLLGIADHVDWRGSDKWPVPVDRLLCELAHRDPRDPPMRPLHQSEQKSVTTSESIHLGEAVGVEVGWAKPAAEYALPPGKALVMLTCDADMRSPLGVQWPTSGPFEARDMIAGVERYRSFYGDRLFGLLWGEGEDVYWLSYESDAKWLVVEIDDPGVERCEKVFFERGRVVHVGDEQAATDFLNAHSGRQPRIVRDDALAQWNKEHGPIAKGEP